jgi:methanogenic corrinoid protein MtbC1
MIRWCAYCQTYIGERPPLEDYSLTHDICDSCVAEDRQKDYAKVAAMRAIGAFYGRLRAASVAGEVLQASQLVDEGLALGLKTADLAWGILQPLLYSIGEQWANGGLSVAYEHRFSETAMAAVEMLFFRDPTLQKLRQHHHPEVLLVMAEGNYHSLGARMAELGLCLQSYSTLTVVPGLPAKEVVALALSLRPRVIAVSVALAPQMRSVRELCTMLEKMPSEDRPRLAIGGSALRLGLDVPSAWGIEVSKDFDLNIT